MTDSQPTPDPAAAGVPTCYRHPDRETYIRCARCDRPICPDCMVSASVGFQCPECVAEGKRTQRVPTTVFGGAIHAHEGVVTTALLVSCVAVYGLQLLIPTFTERFWMLGLSVASGEWYRLITAGFLHGGITHILFNMVALWVFGRPLEQLLGRTRFLTLYMVSLIAGSTSSYLFDPPTTPSLGASGAIFGLVGALLVVGRRLRMNMSWVIGFAVLNLLVVLVVPDVDWRAHVGGLIGGAVLAAAMVYPPKQLRVGIAVLATIAVLGVCLALVAVRTEQIRTDARWVVRFSEGLDVVGPPGDYRPFP